MPQQLTSVTGHVDGIHKNKIHGWAINPKTSSSRVTIEILDVDKVIAIGVADQLHSGLLKKNIGDGHYGFIIELPFALQDGRSHILQARDAQTRAMLKGEAVFTAKADLPGAIEGVSAGVVFGWILQHSMNPSELAFRVDGQVVGKCVANYERTDIFQEGLVGTSMGFRFDLCPYLADSLDNIISVFEVSTGAEVKGSPFRLCDFPAWGVVDSNKGHELSGWVVLSDPKVQIAQIELWLDGMVVNVVAANQWRTDLRRMGVQRTRCGFSCSIPPRFLDGKPHVVQVRLQGSNYLLRGGSAQSKVEIQHQIDAVTETKISGRITNSQSPNHPLKLDIWEADNLITTLVADRCDQHLLTPQQSNWPTACSGFSINLPPPVKGWTSRLIRLSLHGFRESITGKDILIQPRHEVIREVEQAANTFSTLKIMSQAWLQELRQAYEFSSVIYREVVINDLVDSEIPVDIIIPVYKGKQETLECIQSVLQSIQAIRYELIVINDASPDQALTAALRQKASREKSFTLLENSKNLGFVATVNRGMRVHAGRDVILLNSDTLTPKGDWISRLRSAAYVADAIATVTPFSNRATICSLPRNLFDNDLPDNNTVDDLDSLCQRINAKVQVDIPTAVGFCMYIKRSALVEVGYFDEDRWAKGYGEENDFSIRSAALGWRHVAACDVFIQHLGSVSFLAEKETRVKENLAILNQLYPDYLPRVTQFIETDPLWQARSNVVVSLMQARSSRFMVHVMHRWGGGIAVHVKDLCRRLAEEGEATLILRPADYGWMELVTFDEKLVISFPSVVLIESLADTMRQLGVWHIHYHQTIGLPEQVWEIPKQLGIAFDYTIHDYYLGCPRINLLDDKVRYCGQPEDIALCEACIEESALLPEIEGALKKIGNTVKDWRSYHYKHLQAVRCIFAPSKDAAKRFEQFFPLSQIRVQPHIENISFKVFKAIPEQGELRVAILGAVGPHKGHELLLRTARLAQAQCADIRFVIIGYSCDDNAYNTLNNVDIVGGYEPDELQMLIENSDCHVVLFLSPWPETYSYTLSESLRAGLTPLVMDIGAPAERLKILKLGSILPVGSSPSQIIDALNNIRGSSECFIMAEMESTMDSTMDSTMESTMKAANIIGSSYYRLKI